MDSKPCTNATPSRHLEEAHFRFSSRVKKADVNTCWLWTGAFCTNGYGRISVSGRYELAHRLAWEFAKGPIPDGLYVLHACDNKACVRPDHLFLGTQQQNVADMWAKGRGATGSRHGTATHPESRPRGDRNGSRKHPERLNPARGDRSGSRRHPERLLRGEHSLKAKLSEGDIVLIRSLRRAGWLHREIAGLFDISDRHVSRIARGTTWRHVQT